MPRRTTPSLAALLIAGSLSSLTLAASPPAGRLLASSCFQCHGSDGKGPGFERLAGRSAQEIYDEMKELQVGTEGSGLMNRHALGYTDPQLKQLSQWLAKQR